MIKIAIPGMYEQSKMLFNFLKIRKDHPDMFYNDVDIDAVYGNFQFCIWDGGRVFNSYRQTSAEEIIKTVHMYNDVFNIPIRLIFTSNQLCSEHFHNRFCNLVLELCQNEINQIVLVDDDLKDYIFKNYPKYTFISSTTKCLTAPKDALNEIRRDDFVEVCLDFNLNHNFNFLDSLSEDEKLKVEFLCNAICPAGCPSRKEHYKLNSIAHLNFGKRFAVPSCGIRGGTLHPEVQMDPNAISIEDIRNIYAPKGFQHFKLEGRTFSACELLSNLVQYFVKPEFRLYIVPQIINI